MGWSVGVRRKKSPEKKKHRIHIHLFLIVIGKTVKISSFWPNVRRLASQRAGGGGNGASLQMVC